MADNVNSYSRFTALPTRVARDGISADGFTLEELKLQRGNPDRNPALSPMAAPRAANVRLFLKPKGSDQLRLGEPLEPNPDPYEGPQSVLSLSRNALRKLGGAILPDLEQQVQTSIPDVDTKNLMLDSFRRILGMRAYLAELNQMTENVYVRSVAASRG